MAALPRAARLLALITLLHTGCARDEPSFEGQVAHTTTPPPVAEPTLRPTPEEPSFQALGPGITPPVPLSEAPPRLSRQARKSCFEPCVVTLELAVTSKGEVFSARVLRTNSPVYAKAVLEATSTWHYSPALKAGKAIGVFLPVNLSLRPVAGS